MYRVTTEIQFSYGHRLLEYDGKCAHPHGHNARVEVELTAERLDGSDMLVDFTHLKRAIEDWVDQHLDHKMVLRRDDPIVPIFERLEEPVYVMDRNPTAESLARLIYDVAADEDMPVSRVRFWETPTCFATYEGTPIEGSKSAQRPT